MNLKEYQRLFGIKRIDFGKIHRTNLEEECASDEIICPYCKCKIQYEAEETDEIIRGTAWKCPECEKWFYVSAEVTVDTTSVPMEDAVIDHRKYIERSYSHIDECEAHGMNFPTKACGFVEYEVYQKWAKPLFENMGG